MITIGVDVSKKTLVGVALNRFGKTKETFTFNNDESGIGNWLTHIASKYGSINVASEATAEYHRKLALACIKQGLTYRLLNPIVTKQFTKATVRKRKTDLTDALIIAKLALTGAGNMVTETDFDTTKAYTRTAAKLVHLEQTLKLIKYRFSDLVPDDIPALKALDKCIKELKNGTKTFRKKALGKNDKDKIRLLESIPGIGPIVASVVVSEIPDMNKFKSAKSLVAYAGIDPKVKQSGISLKHNTHLTKRGSPYLRQSLFQAANIARVHDRELKAYYEKKRSEGKRYKEAVIATSRKLLGRVYAVLKRGSEFVVR